jgi:hypothetical protein
LEAQVAVELKKRVNEPDGLLPKTGRDSDHLLSALATLVATVAPSLDVTIDVEAEGKSMTAIEANDWIEGKAKTLVERSVGDMSDWRVQNRKSMVDSLRFLKDPASGEIHGRAAFNVGVRYGATGVVTVGGFRAAKIYELIGVLKGETSVVTRQSAMPTVTGPILRAWASEQAELIAKAGLPLSEKLKAASLAMLCGGDASKLPIVIQNDEYLTEKELESQLKELDEVEVFLGTEIDYSEEDDIRPSSFRNSFQVSTTLLFLPKTVPSILTVSNLSWPNCVPDLYLDENPQSCEEAFHRAVIAAWGGKAEFDEDTRNVGEVEGEDIKRAVRIYSRPIDVGKV